MHERIDNIFGRQEREDGAATLSDREIAAAIRRELANGEELLAAARANGIRPTDFFAAEHFPDLPLLPRRTANCFSIRKHTRSQRPYLHAQDFFELICVLRGQCAQSFPDRAPLLLTEGQAALLAPGIAHKLARAGAGDVIVKLIVPPPLFAQVCPFEADGISVFAPRRDRAALLLAELLREQDAEDALCSRTIPSLLTLLFAELLRSREAQPAARTDEELESYLAEHLRDASLADFAARKHYSADYVGKRIRRQTGTSFSRRLNEARLREAARLLAETELSVESIAAAVGYADPAGLYKRFRAAFGMTPGEYRLSFE